MNLFEHIKNVLSQNEKFCKEGRLFKNACIEAGLKLDPALLSLLIKDEKAKKHFFCEVEGMLVFDKIKFQKFVSNKQFLPDSYTAFKNKIGLTAEGEYLTQAGEVVLDFPYKDCVLEGGQTKDDQKRQEIFWNETLAPDEIDRLLEPKLLTRWKRYDTNGEHEVKKVSIADNFIIKGNNLIALHSLKKVYQGKIKLIYIDPPYNTGNDSFHYNDRFNHSTWLTFMKNRLEAGRELLRPDGVIFVQCDDNEQAYLKVLMDEVFGKECFVSCIAYRKTDNQANIGNIARVKEYILLYSKSEKIELNKIPLSEKAKKEYRYSDQKGKFRRAILLDKTRGKKNYNITTPSGKILSGPWMINEKKFEELKKSDIIYWTAGGDEQPYGKIYLNDSKGQIPADWIDKEYGTNQQAAIALEKLLGYRAFDFSKSVPLIKHFIHIGSKKGDIILDFFSGSGTTAHAVLELNKEDGENRKFILCEQMDYIDTITCQRIQKVIERQGGGSFIYYELAQNTERYKKQIQEADDKQALALWQELKESPYISYRADFQKTTDEEFSALLLEDKKEILKSLIDKNSLYIPYADREDSDYKVSEEDKRLSEKFYRL